MYHVHLDGYYTKTKKFHTGTSIDEKENNQQIDSAQTMRWGKKETYFCSTTKKTSKPKMKQYKSSDADPDADLQLEPRPLLLHASLPLPLLSTRALDPLIDPAQLERKPWAQLLQTGTDALDALHLLPVGADDALLGLALLAENVPVFSDKAEVALAVSIIFVNNIIK